MVSKVGACSIVEWATFQWFTVKSPFFLVQVLKREMPWIGVDLNEKALKAFIFSGCVGRKVAYSQSPKKPFCIQHMQQKVIFILQLFSLPKNRQYKAQCSRYLPSEFSLSVYGKFFKNITKILLDLESSVLHKVLSVWIFPQCLFSPHQVCSIAS